jgi:ABC-type branched-subunit amino acid transport system ATPase component/branched-subunit amino acid ABC-type transport system permease component
MWPFVISGLVVGAIYGLAGVGLVLSYKASGIFNFAQGALATVAAYAFYELHVQHDMAWPVAAAIAVLVIGPALGVVFERFGHVLGGASLAVQVTSTVGVLLIVQAAVILIYGTVEVRQVPVFLASGQFAVGGTTVQYSDLITFVFALVATAVLYAFFRYAPLGRAMRALVGDPDLLELTGTSTTTTRRWAWVIGVTFASASGVLFCTLQPLDPTLLTLLVVQAFGAAAIGAFRNLPLTFAGGLVIGIVASLATKWFQTGILAGVPAAFPFIVLFAVLLVFPRRYLSGDAPTIPRARPTWSTPAPIQLAGGALLVAFFAIVPAFAGIHLNDWTQALANVLLFLSLGLLVRESGQLSLCHVGFMAIGATAFGHLTGDLGFPWFFAFVAAALIALPIGALLAIPAIRLTGLYLALATFGFGILLQYMFYTQTFMFGFSGAGIDQPRPTWLGFDSDQGFYYFVLIAVVLSCLGTVALVRGRMGRLLRGMADSPTALATSGTSVNVTRVLVFCISAGMAAAAGALGGMAQGSVTLLSYPPLLSLTYLALIMIVVGSAPWYAVIAAVATTVVPSYVSGATTTNWLQLAFGAFAILYAFTPASAQGVPPALRSWLDRLGRRRSATATAPTAGAVDVPAAARAPAIAGGLLKLEDITVRFGGLVAVDELALDVPAGSITGLIGPNGAGKTTTFNAASGLVRPSSGVVAIDGRDVSRQSVDRRARGGLGRTFQKMELLDSLTVRENVSIGMEGALAGGNPVTHLMSRRRDRPAVAAAVGRALALCDIEDIADAHVAALSTGQRRLVELARCLAGPFRILLLDEPSSGLDHSETERFGQILERVVAERGVGILLVEHDMALVMGVSQHIYVLDFGSLIFEGNPAEVMSSPVVQAAYLGYEGVGGVAVSTAAEGAA